MSGSSGMGSSTICSSIGQRSQTKKGAPRCKCGIVSVIYTSKTEKNFNKDFFGCLYFKEKKTYCNFFRWVDDATNNSIELEECRINNLEKCVGEMEYKLNYVDMMLNNDLQVKVREQEVKINELQIKMNRVSVKMGAEVERVEKKIRKLGSCNMLLAAGMIFMLVACIFVWRRATFSGGVNSVCMLK